MDPGEGREQWNMPALAPLKLTFYDPETNEALGEFICNFVSMRYLKLAIRLSGSKVNINGDTLNGLIIDLFGRQFSVSQLLKYTEASDRLAILQSIIRRISHFMSGNEEEEKIEGKNDEIKKDLEDEITDMQIMLINAFHWNLKDIDEMDIESLFPFMARFIGMRQEVPVPDHKKIYCDQTSGL